MLVVLGVILFIFVILVDIYCIILQMTGLSKDKAFFQVISILTGTGFSTRESELITQHPTRRKVSIYIMITGYIGLGTMIGSVGLLASMLSKRTLSTLNWVGFIVISAITLFLFFDRKVVTLVTQFIEVFALKHSKLKFKKDNAVALLDLAHGYGIMRVLLNSKSTLIGHLVSDIELKSKQIQVLKVDKGAHVISFVDASYVFEAGDCLTLYGRIESIREFFKRSDIL